MMRLCSLGSGSTGNATLIESRGLLGCTRVMVDCGFTLREVELRGCVAPASSLPEVDAIFITHEHGDHVGSALAFARRHGSALWMSRGTWRAIGEPAAAGLGFARDGEPSSRSAASSCVLSPCPTMPASRCSCAWATAPGASAY